MPKAELLPSGHYRVRSYSHSEIIVDSDGQPVIDEKTGKPKKRPIYESFISEQTGREGKKEVDYLAAKFSLNRKKAKKKKNILNLTLGEAVDKYIESKDGVLSPTTIQGYKKYKKNYFQDALWIQLKDLDKDDLQLAANKEAKRQTVKKTTISPKTVRNAYGLISATLHSYTDIDTNITLPQKIERVKELLPPEVIIDVVHGTEIELAALLSMWLSFSISEIRGLSVADAKDGYLVVNTVIVDVDGQPFEKEQAKTGNRTRKHKIPPYIQYLIDQLPPNQEKLVTLSGMAVYARFRRLLRKYDLPHMTFHELRHVNASVMHLLKIPDKYAMERGGWKTDHVMKKVYTHTFADARADADKKVDKYFEKKIKKNNMS